MKSSIKPTARFIYQPRGDIHPRGPAIAGMVVGWALVLCSLAVVTWARFQPAEWTAGKVALAVVVLFSMALGVALTGGSDAHHD